MGTGLGTENQAASIIHAEGVLEWCWGGQPYPRRRRAGWVSIIGAEGAHPAGGGDWVCDPVAQISEIVRADAQAEYFIDHRKEVR
jgi:hypothetical protein